MLKDRHVLVTGASAGIGAAIAQRLHREGARLSLGARRRERLPDLAPALCSSLDVTSEDSIEKFLAEARDANGPIDVLINNAGLARGVESIAEATGEAWREMVETNVMGVLQVTRRVLPEMLAREQGHVLMIGSIAGHEAYEGGSVYCATKNGLQSITKSLRYETLGRGIRVSSVDPGMVDTEFSTVRFSGDQERAASVYAGMRPLKAEDVAECAHWVLAQPEHVNIDTVLVMPTDQASAKRVHRSNP